MMSAAVANLTGHCGACGVAENPAPGTHHTDRVAPVRRAGTRSAPRRVTPGPAGALPEAESPR
jgi:hypothetical protein